MLVDNDNATGGYSILHISCCIQPLHSTIHCCIQISIIPYAFFHINYRTPSYLILVEAVHMNFLSKLAPTHVYFGTLTVRLKIAMSKQVFCFHTADKFARLFFCFFFI